MGAEHHRRRPARDASSARHSTGSSAPTTEGGIPSDFLALAGPLGDIIPIPIPFIRNVASIGDLFLAAGLAFFLFATTVRHPTELEEAGAAAIRRRLGQLWLTPAEAASAEAAAMLDSGALVARDEADLEFDAYDGSLIRPMSIERPLSLGGPSAGSEGTLRRSGWRALPGVPPILERVRRHAYVRLALDSSFSALWTGQLISALGDRIHQIALVFVVYEATSSAIAVGAIFLVATLPNLLFGPIAGTLVDRWDHREVMIVSDLVRAGLVLLIPLAAVTNLALAYPLVFLVTTASIFFRPAKGAILPRIVSQDDLVPANSALWVGETFADIVGYAVAGLFVALLGSQLPLAFWVDSVTYVASAVLIASIAVAPMGRAAAAKAGEVATSAASRLRATVRSVRSELARRLAIPARRHGAPREHVPGDGRAVHARDLPRPDAHLRGGRAGDRTRSRPRPHSASWRARSALGNLVGGFADRADREPARARADGHHRLRGDRRDGRPAPAGRKPARSRSASRSVRAWGISRS